MREVVIIGGGLSGLAAAYELTQQGITPTLIEVKPRLGGGIISHTQDGFIMDGGPMLHAIQDEAFMLAYLDQLGLSDEMVTMPDGLLFKSGTGVLIDHLAQRLSIPIMSRMAVSTLGELDDDRFSICLENGLLLDARAVIVAAPARYAERLFYPLRPQISQALLDYPYASIERVSLGFRSVDQVTLPHPLPPFIHTVQRSDHPSRVPEGGALLQLTIQSDDSVTSTHFLWEGLSHPVIQWKWQWSESDPIAWKQESFPQIISTINDQLPQRMTWCGSDTIVSTSPPTLDQRLANGMQSAKLILNNL